MKVKFHTNLNLHPAENFPESLVARPVVGDIIRSKHKWDKCQIELVVVYVELTETEVLAELHLPKRWTSIKEFYKEFYEPLTGRKYV